MYCRLAVALTLRTDASEMAVHWVALGPLEPARKEFHIETRLFSDDDGEAACIGAYFISCRTIGDNVNQCLFFVFGFLLPSIGDLIVYCRSSFKKVAPTKKNSNAVMQRIMAPVASAHGRSGLRFGIISGER